VQRKFPPFTIPFSVPAGRPTTRLATAAAVCAAATRLGVGLRGEIAGIEITVCPGDEPEMIFGLLEGAPARQAAPQLRLQDSGYFPSDARPPWFPKGAWERLKAWIWDGEEPLFRMDRAPADWKRSNPDGEKDEANAQGPQAQSGRNREGRALQVCRQPAAGPLRLAAEARQAGETQGAKMKSMTFDEAKEAGRLVDALRGAVEIHQLVAQQGPGAWLEIDVFRANEGLGNEAVLLPQAMVLLTAEHIISVISHRLSELSVVPGAEGQ
jgi:hypothetical protein